jgi:UDP-N-acetylmuramate dehydrogenase
VTDAVTHTVPRIREAGDSALLVELEPVIDPGVNARAVAIANALRREPLPGVRDIVSTYRSVAVFFDPLRTDLGAVTAAIHRASDAGPRAWDRPPIDVPVVYGGDSGPDLEDVAAFGGCAARDVIERHTSPMYRVFMVGFLPGFAYMGTVDDAIAAPRRATPRLRVPAGSVGIAGKQTGIYPCDSPGGWQIIGHANVEVFDASRTPPALFAPGDRVRFIAVSGGPLRPAPHESRAGLHSPPDGTGPGLYGPASIRSVTVLRPGLSTTVQDEGRWGHQNFGVPVSGPMDSVAHRLANAIVGNPRDAATLEATLMGPELRVEQETAAAITGADLSATLDGVEVPRDAPVRCRAGSVMRFGPRRAGVRAYVAFGGGISTPPVLGSRATHVVGRLGGVEGRALQPGDRLPLGETTGRSIHRKDARWSRPNEQGTRLRVLPGPQDGYFTAEAMTALQQTRFTVSPQSDRMGYRLTPERPVAFEATGTMISDVTFLGGLQVPPSGSPILLMADRQTAGGYPQIVTVITADLPLAGQLAREIGSSSRFVRAPRRWRRSSHRKGGCLHSAERLALQADVPLAPFSSLGVGGRARWFLRAASVEDVSAAHRWCEEQGSSLFVLGGGSNLVVADEGVDGLVLQVSLRGVDTAVVDADTFITAAAGEPWDEIVRQVVGRGLAGLECLSGIPGSVGGTPIQNVGAYGQEVADTIHEVAAFDRSAGRLVTLPASACAFEYRNSRFKREDAGRFIVCAVTFRLRPGEGTATYPDLTAYLDRAGEQRPHTPAAVRDAVLAVRRRKGMVIDPADPDTRSVGSFFMNPIVTSETHARLKELEPGSTVPGFVLGSGDVKVPAAWLIERAGFAKGFAAGAVGLSSKHPLAIINRGGASARDVVTLALRIKKTVAERFGIWLRPEPMFVGFSGDADVEYLQRANS